MPYRWQDEPTDPPSAVLQLWPHRSLTPEGFVIFIAVTAVMLALPLFALLGTLVLWGLLPFLAAALGGMWWALTRSNRDGTLSEELTLDRDRIRLVRREPDGTRRSWQANPYWVKVTLHRQGGPVEDYLTLRGDGREVEIGAFLSPEERRALAGEIRDRLARLR
ncbi:DUF2244 domain-containing protein [Albidovulum sp.]